MNQWSKESWRTREIKQQPTYPDQEALKAIEKELGIIPPLVFAGEVRKLKNSLSLSQQGKAFFLQGGDCAESFEDFNANNIRYIFKVLMQ